MLCGTKDLGRHLNIDREDIQDYSHEKLSVLNSQLFSQSGLLYHSWPAVELESRKTLPSACPPAPETGTYVSSRQRLTAKSRLSTIRQIRETAVISINTLKHTN